MELTAEELTLIERFREHAADKRRAKLEGETSQLERDEKKHKEEHRKRETEQKEQEEVLLATTAQIAAFNHELDNDTAAVNALMVNQEKIDAVRLRLDRTEGTAFHLDDGRPEAIPSSRPTWEVWQADKMVEHDLLQQRDDIHAFQHRLDKAREQSGQKDLSADALAKIDADLKAAMPQAVRDASEHPGGTLDSASVEGQGSRRPFQAFERPLSAPMARPSPM